MAQPAVAPEAIRALRREIARIEGRLPSGPVAAPESAPFQASAGAGVPPPPGTPGSLAGGDAQRFEAAIGGLPRDGLVEITTGQARDAGAAAGFALALAALCAGRAGPEKPLPVLWIATAAALAELGTPYLGGLRSLLGADAPPLLLARTPRLVDALWIAEEAAAAGGLGPVLVETQGSGGALDLLATRRLHRRAKARHRVLLLLRHGAVPEPTAAPLRLAVGPAPARPRDILGRPLAGTIGAPAFIVTVAKSRSGRPASFILDWSADEQRFTERPAAHPGAVVPAPGDRPDPAQPLRPVLAFRAGGHASSPGNQPQGEQPPDPLRARRAG